MAAAMAAMCSLQHCHGQAKRLRRLAETETDEKFRDAILELARQYERIAQKIEGGVDDPAVATLAAAVAPES
jgi:hypothetical protein